MSQGRVIEREWTSRGLNSRRAKRRAYGFTIMVDGEQIRRISAEWKTREAAANALAAYRLGLAPEPVAAPAPPGIPFGQAAARYLLAKSRKRSLREDRRLLDHLKGEFGGETPLIEITAKRINAYKDKRLAIEKSRRGAALSAASINRPLSLLRHLLRLAHEEWEVLPAVPKIRLEKEPQGRIRWLEPDEERRLLDACRVSRTRHLAAVVTIALESGLRQGEVLGLTWDRVDFSRGLLRLEITKSGRRREVPMRQAVHDVLSALSSQREGRVWPATSIRKAWEAAVAEAKLDDFHFHDTRHHFASWYMMRGGSLKALQEILGHADIKMTLRYAHLSPDHLRSEMLRTERGQHIISTTVVESPSQIAQVPETPG